MTLVKIGYRMARNKASYFDRMAVISKMDKVTHAKLLQFGSFVRRTDQQMQLRHVPPKGFGVKSKTSNRPGTSPVGTPPYPHVGTIVKNVEFYYDDIKQSVIIGHPLIIGATGTRDAVHALEYSGPSLMKSTNKATFGQILPIMVKARPAINPAFQYELPDHIRRWENAMEKV